MSNADLDKFLGECPTHKKLPWKIGAMESGQVAIDSDDGKEVTGWIDPEDACLILNQQQRIEELERDLLNLVCRIHRDGGHYIAKYGEAKAIADADTVAAQNNADLDALQADNARLREVLDEAATSLETIQLRSYGDESYLNHMDQVRGFAGSRSRVAKEALSSTPEQSLAEYRNKVIEECAALCDERSKYFNRGAAEQYEAENCASAIRAMKEQP